MTVRGSNAAQAAASPPYRRLIVCCLVPELGPRSPPMSSKVENMSGCITVRSMAHVPPMDQPTTPQFAGSDDAPNREITNGRTSFVRWSAAFPRGPFTHSVSLLKLPLESTKMNSGAAPPCFLAYSSITPIALPVRIQLVGLLNSPAIIITAGSRGGASPVNQIGGRYAYSRRCVKPLASLGTSTGT